MNDSDNNEKSLDFSKYFPLMPEIRNNKFDELNTILLWNLLPNRFTWEEFEYITNYRVDRSTSWGYKRLRFWVKWGQIERIEQGIYIKTSK